MYQSHAFDNSPERSQPLESTAGQNQQDLTDGEASDSGDSLFITQKEIPSPVRSARRHRHGKRSGLTPSRCLEESESSSSSSQEKSRTHKKTTRKKSSLPAYTFSVLADNKSDGLLPSQKNRILHTFAVAGFFKCLSEFDTKTSSPTVDADEEDISPLSEEEEEQSHTEAFRVVDKMCFAAALKATSRRSWCSQRKRQKRMNAGCVGETLRENGLQMQENIPAEASTSTIVPLLEHRKNSDDVVHSSKALGEDEQDTPTQNTALKTNRCLTLGTKEANMDNSNASVCEQPDVDGGGEVCNQTQREEMVHTQGHQTLLHTTSLSPSNNESICIDMRVKKSKKKKKNAQIHASMEGQRQEEPEDVCLLESVALIEPQAPQSSDETESHERRLHDDKTDREEERTSRKHGKRKTRKTKAANTLWEEHLESDVIITDSMISLEGGGKKEKNQDNDDVRQSAQSSTTDGAFSDAEGMKFKGKKNKKDKKGITADEREESVKSSGKGLALETGVELSYPKSIREVTNALEDSMANTKGSAEDQRPEPVKKKKQKHEVKMDSSEDSVPQSDFSAAVQKKEKRRTSSFLCADAVETDVQTAGKHISVRAEDLGTQSAEITEDLEQSDCRVKKKKRKRKHDYKDDADTGAERKKDSGTKGNGLGTTTEMRESAAVLGPLKKKSKDDSCCMSEQVSTHVGTFDRVSTHVGTFDRFFKQASYSQTPGKLALKEKNSKMEPNSSADLLQEELVTTSKHLEFRKKKKGHTAALLTSEISFSKSKISSPDRVVSKKHKNLKRKLYHPVEDLLE